MKKNTLRILSALTALLTLAGCSQGNSFSGEAMTGAAADNYFVYEESVMTSNAALGGVQDDFKYSQVQGVEPDYNTEEYDHITENSYMSSVSNPLSTFSIDVDTASYTNLRRMINIGYSGEEIPAEAIRIEEMINYFGYDYPAPQGNDPFSVTTELTDCPWNPDTKLMMIGLQGKEVELQDRPPMNLVFLIDVSGSMYDEDKLPLVQKSFSMLTENLTPQDRISIVTYAGDDRVVLQGADGNQKQEILEAINSLEAGGSTAGAKGINTAYKIAEKYFISGGNNRVILATDGDLNVGVSSTSDLTELIEKKRESGVFLSVLGFGTGNIKDNKMEALADNGNGNYSYIDSPVEARKVLVNEMSGTLITIAKDVKIQVEFNPAYVKGYRLIGYENRVMAAEDFEDDTKDAGEIGAGHTVTALYEVVMNDSPMDFGSSDLKYGESAGVENGEISTVSIRYKDPDGTESKLLTFPVSEGRYSSEMSPNLNVSSAVAQFGLVLRDSEYKGTATYASILNQLYQYDYSGDEYKNEFIHLVNEIRGREY